jgi:hypothetical protein
MGDERGEVGVAVDSRPHYRGTDAAGHLQRSGLSLAMPPKSQRRTGLPWCVYPLLSARPDWLTRDCQREWEDGGGACLAEQLRCNGHGPAGFDPVIDQHDRTGEPSH